MLYSDIPNNLKFIAFRPENVTLEQKDLFEAKIETIQNLEVEQIITLNCKDEIIRALVKPDVSLKLNENIKVYIPKEHFLFFDNSAKRVYL